MLEAAANVRIGTLRSAVFRPFALCCAAAAIIGTYTVPLPWNFDYLYCATVAQNKR